MTKETNKPTVWGKAIPGQINFGSVVNVVHYLLHKFTVYPFLIPNSQFSILSIPEYEIPLSFFLPSLCLRRGTGYSEQGFLACNINLDTPAGNALFLVNLMVACQHQSCTPGTNGTSVQRKDPGSESLLLIRLIAHGFSWHNLQSKSLWGAFWISYHYP